MKVFVYAYDRINFGDDLFIHTLCNRYPDVNFYLWSKKYNIKTFKSVKNLKVLDQDSKFLNFLKRLHPSLYSRYKCRMEEKCNAVVYIGGSIFIEYDNWEQILTWWDYEALNRKFYILGANFGPYKTEAYRNKLADILANVEDVCFRDKYSFDLFKNVDKVRYAPDILFNYDFANISNKKQIFISVIDCASRNSGLDKLSDNEEKYINLISKYIKSYAENGYSIILSSFCKIENDEESVEKIINQLSVEVQNKVNIINYDGTNTDKLTSAIADSELVIASRFHASVLGFAANKPVFPIVYSDKTINILKDLSFEGKYIDIRKLDGNSYVEPINIQYDKQVINDIKSIKKKSCEHFCKLDILLKY
ncbi:MAG: polysaccharide pyruvyl transferase family protein [Eubacterium sp.]